MLITRDNSFFKPLAVCSLLVASFFAQASHSLNADASSLHFMSTKNEHITEQHTFKTIAGDIDNHGALSIDIDLSSVETIIPIRNERMRKMLFDVAQFPDAKFTAQLDKSLLSLKPGEEKVVQVAGTLSLKDKAQNVSTELSIVGLQGGAIKANTIKPILLNTQSLGVQDGIDALQAIAHLKSISKTVPVTFSVLFEQN